MAYHHMHMISSNPKLLTGSWLLSALVAAGSLAVFTPLAAVAAAAPQKAAETEDTKARPDVWDLGGPEVAPVLVPQAEVERHVAEFTVRWKQTPLAHDARFGTIRILSMLNLDHPGMEKIKAAAERKDYDAAQVALLEYFKSSRAATNPAPKLDERSKLVADQALAHLFRGNGDVHPPVFRGLDIDWTGRAFANGTAIHDHEWYFQFQRLTWWPSLARAVRATGDVRYFNEWRFELATWADKLLPYTRQTPVFITRGMENDVRCSQMTAVFPDMLSSPDFDAKTLLYFLGSFHDQADHITTVYAAAGNHRLGELSRVFRNAMAFPEFKRATAWKNDALTLLPKMMEDSVYADGMNKELVFSYHTMYIGLFANAYKMFTESGNGHLLPDFYYPRLLKMAEIYAMQAFPDFSICQFGDAWKGGNAGGLFRKDKDMGPFVHEFPYAEFMASGGKTGTPPAKTSVAYPESGFYFFRSAWNPDAVFMALKCGEEAEWHNQIDNGTFELYAHGQNLMIDSGCYLYGSSDPEEQKWRAWFRSTKAHQTLTLDNRDANRKPKHVLWSDSDNLTALVVDNQSYEGLKHRRTVLFIDKKYFIIRDQAIGKDAGAVRIHFQFAPCDFTLDGHVAQSRFAEGGNLLVRTFPQDKPVSTAKEEGWISYKINQKAERPAWSWKIDKSAEDAQVGFLTALVPNKQGAEASPIQAKCTDEGNTMTIEVQDGKGKMSITLDLDRATAVMKSL